MINHGFALKPSGGCHSLNRVPLPNAHRPTRRPGNRLLTLFQRSILSPPLPRTWAKRVRRLRHWVYDELFRIKGQKGGKVKKWGSYVGNARLFTAFILSVARTCLLNTYTTLTQVYRH